MNKQNPLVAWVLNIFTRNAVTAPLLPQKRVRNRDDQPAFYPGAKLDRKAHNRKVGVRHGNAY